MMKKNSEWLFAFFLLIIAATSSCQSTADTFNSGVWMGVLLMVVVIVLVLWLRNRGRK